MESVVNWLVYEPDVVLFCGGYNNVGRSYDAIIDYYIHSFHSDHPLGKQLSRFYLRSRLYTYVVEKYFFSFRTRRASVAERLRFFEERLREFVHLVSGRGAEPMLALEVSTSPVMGQVHDVMRRVSADTHTILLNPTTPHSPLPHFTDEVHLTEAGYRIVGEQMAAEFVRHRARRGTVGRVGMFSSHQ